MDSAASRPAAMAAMAMPAAAGTQHVITVFIRSANVDKPQNPTTPLRPAGRVVFSARGLDVAAVQQFDLSNIGFNPTEIISFEISGAHADDFEFASNN